ncbi:hypothetical protein IH601_06390 [Candidatus Bipolaricaulota bacterium]|nr:hypothetical protein [Candidatus Bipolaricaulota bacterium]
MEKPISRGTAVEGKVMEMDKTLDRKPPIDERLVKPEKPEIMEPAQKKAEVGYELTEQHASWWSNLRFWIRELRWRRAFWKKMGLPINEEDQS